MKIISKSGFKSESGFQEYSNWVQKVAEQNGIQYELITIQTSLGSTQVYIRPSSAKETLVIFPGFRTSSLFWDLDNGLSELSKYFKIYLVETNGQPNGSDGNTPSIKSLDYGYWAKEVLIGLSIQKTSIAGASFGGTVALKLSTVAPEMIDKVFLLNPGCLQNFSMNWTNLKFNLLPIISPSRKNIERFLNEIVFHPPIHTLSPKSFEIIVEYQLMALKSWKDKAQKPYGFSKIELNAVSSDVYLLEGENDLLFPYEKSIHIAKENLPNLIDYKMLPSTGHGIECSSIAMKQILDWLNPNY